MSTKPPCAEWDIWTGPEIEGTTDLGEKTVFIRRLRQVGITEKTDFSFIPRSMKANRLWLCKEFLHDCMTDETRGWGVVRRLASYFAPQKVCLEVTPATLVTLPADLRKKHRLYLKVILPAEHGLKDDDFVCVGPAYEDAAFVYGQGARVKPEQYLGDIKIL